MTLVAFTGHRPPKLGGYDNWEVHNQIYRTIIYRLRASRPAQAVSGMALGVDQIAFQACLFVGVPVTAAVPFVGQESRWPKAKQEDYHRLLARASSVKIVSSSYDAHAMQKRNEWMVDIADELWAVWNGSPGGTANCIAYSKKQGKPIVNLWDPRWFE